jgi:hypothetical protein
MLGLTTTITGDWPYYKAFNEYSLSLDGADDYAAAIVARNTYRGSFTFSFLVHLIDGQPSSEQTLIGINSRGSEDHFYINLMTSGKIKVYHSSNNDPATTITDEAIFANAEVAWQRISVVVELASSSTYTIFIGETKVDVTTTNGVSETNHGLFDDFADSVPTGFGCLSDNNFSSFTRQWQGHLDEVAVWSAALDQENISQIWNEEVPFDLTSNYDDYDTSASLVNYYRFEEGTGTSVEDLSTNSNTATLVGATFSSFVMHRGASI